MNWCVIFVQWVKCFVASPVGVFSLWQGIKHAADDEHLNKLNL